MVHQSHIPQKKKLESERFLEMYKEDLEVPVLILNDSIKANLKNPLIDSMDAMLYFYQKWA